MNLTIDIGNTSAKIAVFEGANLVFFERVCTDWHTEIGKLQHEYLFKACAISNVAGENYPLDCALQMLKCPVMRLHYTSPEAQPYFKSIPTGLGADRLAADIAAVTTASDSPVLVIDAGTCLTFDVINSERQFVGGSISPGIALRLRSMHEHTAALPLVDLEGELPDFGYDTPTALRSGAANGVKYEIEGYIRMCMQQFPDIKVFYTGGDRLRFSDNLRKHIIMDDLLVLKGLNTLIL